MPASRKPRKKHQKKLGWSAYEKHCSFLFRSEKWDRENLNLFAQDTLEPFHAIYYGRGEDPNSLTQFRRSQKVLIFFWILAELLVEETEVRRIISEADKLLETVFTCWYQHAGRILYPQMKRLIGIVRQLFEAITDAFSPYEIFKNNRTLKGKKSQAIDFLRGSSKLSLSGDEPDTGLASRLLGA